MHEFSISSEIVKKVLNTAEKNNGKRVLSIQLEIGELTLLNVEQITFWVQELFKGSIAENAKVKVKKIKARITCEGCGYQGEGKLDPEDTFRHSALQHCPQCHSFQIRVEKGQECNLRRIQVFK